MLGLRGEGGLNVGGMLTVPPASVDGEPCACGKTNRVLLYRSCLHCQVNRSAEQVRVASLMGMFESEWLL